MNELTFTDGEIFSANDIHKSWHEIFQTVKDSNKPVFVCANNTPEVVVLSFKEFQTMQKIVEAARREQLGKKMVCDLLDIARLTSQPIKHMHLNKKSVFEEAEAQ